MYVFLIAQIAVQNNSRSPVNFRAISLFDRPFNYLLGPSTQRLKAKVIVMMGVKFIQGVHVFLIALFMYTLCSSTLLFIVIRHQRIVLRKYSTCLGDIDIMLIIPRMWSHDTQDVVQYDPIECIQRRLEL